MHPVTTTPLHWGDRIADLRRLVGGRICDLVEATGVSPNTLRKWLHGGKLPGLDLAVQVSGRSGYSLEALVSEAPLRRPHFTPDPAARYRIGTWAKALRGEFPTADTTAISRELASRSVMHERCADGWLGRHVTPSLALAVETARALRVPLDSLLARGAA